MATISVDELGSLDPVLTQATDIPSPAEEKALLAANAEGVKQRISGSPQAGPTVRQRTQSEILDLELERWRRINPHSVRYIPFEQLREMTTDLMFGFGWYFTMAPLVRAGWDIVSPDAQLAAAVDEAFRPIATQTFLAFSNALWYGHQPLIKRFRLGKLGGFYRDPQAKDPDIDIPVWTSSADALLWKTPMTVNPTHCLPMWDEDGDMMGFKFSTMPIPNYDLISAASMYGYEVIPGHVIGPDYAMWITNEASMGFGSIYGSPRTKRGYRYWWSYWYRWALADRAFENHVDPPKVVYYPTGFDEFIDNDGDNPQATIARDKALRLGDSARSGATVALPNDFVEGAEGKPTGTREWEIAYLNSGQSHFSDLDQTFGHLDTLKLRAWFVPEQAFIEGRGATSSRNVAAQLGEVYQESEQMLGDEYDGYVSDNMIPQFIAANFPDKIGTPCRRQTRGMGAIDEQLMQQVLTLIGQVRGEVMPVDVRALLARAGIPLLSEAQMTKEVENIAKLAAIQGEGQQQEGPPPRPPEAVGTQGYNAGVQRTLTGETRYFQPPQRIVLAESDGYINDLPDTPHYRDPGVRSALVRLRRLFMERYREQYSSFADFLERQATLNLADQPSQPQQGLQKQDSKRVAAAIISSWAAAHAAGVPGAATEAVGTDETAGKMADLIGKIALVGGSGALKGARLDADDFGADVLKPWVHNRVGFALDSIDNTVRSEGQNWLEGQLSKSVDPKEAAAAAREHFHEMPTTHSDRVVRTETAEAYNRGMLTALDLAGVSQVQAHDASDGTDTKTDAPCLSRDGAVMSVKDAMGEQLMHPNCTLYFTPLATDAFRVERVKEMPTNLAAEDDVVYDEPNEVLYLLEDATDERERFYLKIIGAQLAYR